MWVYFNMDEPTALQIHELAREGKFGPSKEGRPPKIPFHMQLANEKSFPHEATLDFVNNQLDPATATLLIRAVFSNLKPANGPRVFAPNNFVRPCAHEPAVPGAAGECGGRGNGSEP